jgi:hypothetical protein
MALIIAWYAPGAAGLFDSSDQRWGSPLGWWSMVTGPFELLPTSMFLTESDFGTAAGLLLALLLAPLLILGVREARALIPGLAAITAPAMVWPFVFLTASRFFVMPRFFSYLLVPTLALVALGARRILCSAGGFRWIVARQYLGVVFAGGAGIFAPTAWTITAMPREDVRGAARAIQQADPNGRVPVLANLHFLSSFTYYLPPSIRLQPISASGPICAPHPHGLVFVDSPYHTPRLQTSCLVEQGAALHRFWQWSRGGRIDVWVVPPS